MAVLQFLRSLPNGIHSAQVIDGSLKFDEDAPTYAKRLLVLQGIEMFGLGLVGSK